MVFVPQSHDDAETVGAQWVEAWDGCTTHSHTSHRKEVSITTKKELSQLFWLNREIDREKQRLEELECAARGGTAKISGMPRMDGIARTQEQYAVLIAEQRDLLELKVRQLVVEYNRLNRYIATVEDSLMRQILSLRYVDGMSWVQVANQVGGGNTADSVRKQCNRFLDKNKSCPECPIR